ncbi:MAG TPA: hypothetical protein VG796_01110 [Verrucomicrobiales bacterium]|nr:hypothetical protein [Verrucomicrobiales bacterium]
MIYKFPLWIPGIAIAVVVIAAAAGVFFWWKRSQWLPAVILLAIAMFGGGIIAPGLLMDRVVLDDTKLQQTTGFWFSPTIKGFNLAGLKSIRIIKVKAMGRNDRDHDEWIATMKSGRTEQLDPGDLWENNTDDIVDCLKARGIEVTR